MNGLPKKGLRFWDNEVFENIEGFMGEILRNVKNHPSLTPPLKGGEKQNTLILNTYLYEQRTLGAIKEPVKKKF